MSAQPIDEQYLIFSAEINDELDAGKEALKNYYRNHGINAEVVRPADLETTVLKKAQGGLVVSIIGHFHGQADSNAQALYITSKKAIGFKEFADLIEIKWKLPKDKIKELRLAAYYTDQFAQDLANELGQRGYINVDVTGYRGELNVSHGVNGGMIAGLSLDRTIDPSLYWNKYDKKHPNYKDGWNINWDNFDQKPELKVKYAAVNFACTYNTKLTFQATHALAAASSSTQPASAVSHSSARTSLQANTDIEKALGTSSRRGSFSEPTSSVHESLSQAMIDISKGLSGLQVSGGTLQPSGNPPNQGVSRAITPSFELQHIKAEQKQNTAGQPNEPTSASKQSPRSPDENSPKGPFNH